MFRKILSAILLSCVAIGAPGQAGAEGNIRETVYIINGSSPKPIATFPLKKFLPIGINK
jgi:hypothetical protein